jgi:hypothetical protein
LSAFLLLMLVLPRGAPAQDNVRMLSAVKSWVAETGNQVIALGSWVSGGSYKPGSSDHDMRLIVPAGTPPADAAKRWKTARAGLEAAIRREFGAERAKDILAKTNLYAPSQLMSTVGNAEDAARVYTRLNQVPNMAFSRQVTQEVPTKYIEGLYGDGTKAFTQYYEDVKGRFIYRTESGVYAGTTDLTHMEEGWAKFTVSGTANTALQWGEHALDELANNDLRAVGKHLERLEKDLVKSRELAGLETNTTLRNELRALRNELAEAGAGRLKELSGRIRGLVARGQSEARLLTGIAKSGPLQRGMYRLVLDAIEAKSALGSLLRKGFDTVSKQVTFENFIHGLVLYAAATSISEAYAKSWLETAKQAASFYYLLPTGLMMQITDAILEEAKATGFIFAAGSQEAWDLMAGIYTALGRRRTDPDPERSYQLGDLVRNYHAEARLKALVYSQAMRAADLGLGSDNQQIDMNVAEAIYRRCMPVILQAWRMKRDELIGEYASIVELIGHAPLLVAYTPMPASVEHGPVTVRTAVSSQVRNLGEQIERLDQIVKLLSGKSAWVGSAYEWKPEGEGDEMATISRSYAFAKPGVYPVKVRLQVKPHGPKVEGDKGLIGPCEASSGVDIEVVNKAEKPKPVPEVKKPKPAPKPEPDEDAGGYWRFTGERFVKGKPFLVGPADPTKVDASGGGSALTAVCSARDWRSVAAFSWKASKGLDVLKPDDRISFTGTLTHSGNGSAMAGISIQPYGQEPGTGHISGMTIMHGFDGTANRTTTRPGDLTVPEGSRYSKKPIELRFEVYPGGATSALYRTYEWTTGKEPKDAGKAAPENPNWSGSWSSDFGRMSLQQSGSRVTGSYDFKGGRLEGTVAGNVLRGRWTQTNDSGSFEFEMSADGRSFSGRWGYGDSLTRGKWNGSR